MHYNLVYSYQIFDVMAAKPLRMVLEAMIIQTKFRFAAPELVEQTTEEMCEQKTQPIAETKTGAAQCEGQTFPVSV